MPSKVYPSDKDEAQVSTGQQETSSVKPAASSLQSLKSTKSPKSPKLQTKPKSDIKNEQQDQTKPRNRRGDATFMERLKDGCSTLCPDCSRVQWIAIIGGLTVAIILTLLLLWAGGYWKKKCPFDHRAAHESQRAPCEQ